MRRRNRHWDGNVFTSVPSLIPNYLELLYIMEKNILFIHNSMHRRFPSFGLVGMGI